jgi:hypothetical protein
MNLDMTRRDFIRNASVATLAAASLPSALAANKPITLAFVGCAHIHTPGFVNAVAGQKDQPLVTPREAAARVSVMEAMYKAARDRKWEKPA